ncbi:MAG TPA: dihydroneopterin aldolase [Propionibacteriaceae bacterium]|nr:dihydroneopterin aldolase [Propionibacteriaceae bacterium]
MRSLTPAEYEALQRADRIEVVGISSEGVHGLYEDEALGPQPFGVDVTMWLDMSAAVAGDRIGATIDYVEASEVVRHVVKTSTVLLVESLAAAVCEAILDATSAVAVSVTVHKPRAARDTQSTDVRLTMTRTR